MKLQEIRIPFELTKSDTAIPKIKELVDDYGRVQQVTYKNGMLIMRSEQDVIVPLFNDLKTIIANNGSFCGIKFGLKINKSKLITEMPKTVEGSTCLIEEEEVTRTWGEWLEAGNILPVEKLDGADKIMKASRNGHTLDSTELDKLNKEIGIEVLDWNSFIDLTNSVDYKESEK